MKKGSLKLFFTSQTAVYLGRGGFNTKSSFIKRLTSSEFPMGVFFSSDTVNALIPDLAVFIVLYLR